MPAAGRAWTLVGALRHRAALVCLLTVIGAAAAVVADLLRPPTYEATALIYLDARTNSSQGFDLALQASELVSSHLVQVSTTRPVLEAACRSYGDTTGDRCSPAELAGMVSASTVRTTSMLGVSVRTRDRAAAAPLANAVAAALIAQNRAEVDAALKPTATYLDAELKDLSAQIAAEQTALAQLASDPSPGARAQAANAQAQLTLIQSEYSAAFQKKQDLLLNQAELEASVSLYQPATTPAAPVDPNLALYVAGGLAAGLAGGVGAAVLAERLDGRLRGLEELAEATGAPVALSIPTHALKPGSREQVRHYALARTHLLAAYPEARTIVVAAASPGDRAYPVAIGIGAVAARAGQRVLVVDAEDRTPMPARRAASNGHAEGDGAAPVALRSELAGGGRRGRAVRGGRGGVARRLDFMAVDPDHAADGPEMDGAGYDLTVIAAPAPYADAAGICLARPGAVAAIVASARATAYEDARRAAAALQRAGIEVGAAVLVSPRGRRRAEPAVEGEVLLPAPPEVVAAVPSWRGPTPR